MNKRKKIYQMLLLLFAFVVVFLLGGLIVLKIKEDEKPKTQEPKKNTPIKEENNYIDEYILEDMLKVYKNIDFNSNTSIENIKLYGLESLNINKISVENGKLKYYSDDKEYQSNNLSGVKYIEYATDDETYSEILVYTLNGIYYFNTNGNAEIVDEDAYKNKFKETEEKALYNLDNDKLNLTFIKSTNTYSVNGIGTLSDNGVTYFVVRTSLNTYVLDYTKTTKFGVKMVTSVTLGKKLSDYLSNIGTIGKDKKIYVNYDLSLKTNEVLKYEDNILYPKTVYLSKDAYYFILDNNDIYELKLSDFEDNKIIKYNTKEVEKISLEEEKTYQGETITSVKQYLKVLYKDGNIEEIQ